MGVDVFLMGTAGDFADPNRSKWREPIKAELEAMGISAFDPVIRIWTDEQGKLEVEALREAKVLAIYVDTTMPSIVSMIESGYALLNAVQNDKKVILRIKLFGDEAHSDTDDRWRKSTLNLARAAAQEGAPMFVCESDEQFLDMVVGMAHNQREIERLELETMKALPAAEIDNIPF